MQLFQWLVAWQVATQNEHKSGVPVVQVQNVELAKSADFDGFGNRVAKQCKLTRITCKWSTGWIVTINFAGTTAAKQWMFDDIVLHVWVIASLTQVIEFNGFLVSSEIYL